MTEPTLRQLALTKYKKLGKSDKEIESYMRGWDMADRGLSKKRSKK